MIFNIGDNIVSPLGWTSDENWCSVLEGKSGGRLCIDSLGVPEPFFASLLDDDELETKFLQLRHSQDVNYTKLEKMAIISVADALSVSGISPQSDEVVLILSTTKGNVELLETSLTHDRAYLTYSAQRIADYFRIPTAPVVVSNACISGCAAQVTANRLLHRGGFRYAIVCGVDVLSKFIVSGFQSFKALSAEQCKPFDAHRTGLNLGEAAATIVYAKDRKDVRPDCPCACLVAGAICNDANHISGPSRTAEGLTSALSQILASVDSDRIAFVNAHGTATRYNDDMESVALSRTGLSNLPVNSLKGYFGHTLGAAGILEVILSTRQLQHHTILRTLGCEEPGTVQPVRPTQKQESTDKSSFVKMISGFGGGNAALLVSLETPNSVKKNNLAEVAPIRVLAQDLCYDGLWVRPDGSTWQPEIADPKRWMSELYRQLDLNYPKFFKMDKLSKLGTLAAEMVMRHVGQATDELKSDWAVVCFNRASSLDDDRSYQNTIADADNYFPSPSVFVYTLANIVAGELAIKYRILGETSFYIAEHPDVMQMERAFADVLDLTPARFVLGGWLDFDNGHCSVRLFIVSRSNDEKLPRFDEMILE